MVQQLSPKFRKALAAEISIWQQESLITRDIADMLLARYPTAGNQGVLITVMAILGSVLVGLGTLLFIGANWNQIAAVYKLIVIFSAIVAAHAAGWYFRFEPGSKPKLGTALLLLGSLFYGAGIWLIAQIFNLDINFTNGLLLWAAGTMASALVTRVAALGVLANLVCAYWLLSHNPMSAASGGPADTVGMLRFAAATASSMFIAYVVRSPWAMTVCLLGTVLWVAFWSGTEQSGLLAWGIALFGGYLWHKKNWQLFAKPFMFIGTASALTAMLVVTCGERYAIDLAHIHVLAMLLFLALLGVALAAYREKETPPEVVAAFFVVTAFYFIPAVPGKLVPLVLHNINALLAMVLLVFAGLNRLRSIALVNMTIVFFVLFIIFRYFDMFFTMLDRSVFFIAGGIVLLVVGSFAESRRRKLIGGLQG